MSLDLASSSMVMKGLRILTCKTATPQPGAMVPAAGNIFKHSARFNGAEDGVFTCFKRRF